MLPVWLQPSNGADSQTRSEIGDRSSGGSMIPKSRLDSLTDGIFAFAMTLLVLGLNLPPSFQPKSDADLIAALTNLDD